MPRFKFRVSTLAPMLYYCGKMEEASASVPPAARFESISAKVTARSIHTCHRQIRFPYVIRELATILVVCKSAAVLMSALRPPLEMRPEVGAAKSRSALCSRIQSF